MKSRVIEIEEEIYELLVRMKLRPEETISEVIHRELSEKRVSGRQFLGIMGALAEKGSLPDPAKLSGFEAVQNEDKDFKRPW